MSKGFRVFLTALAVVLALGLLQTAVLSLFVPGPYSYVFAVFFLLLAVLIGRLCFFEFLAMYRNYRTTRLLRRIARDHGNSSFSAQIEEDSITEDQCVLNQFQIDLVID